MCQYCESPNDLIFTNRKGFSICVADGHLYINDEKHGGTESLPIKYCPICGAETIDTFDEN